MCAPRPGRTAQPDPREKTVPITPGIILSILEGDSPGGVGVVLMFLESLHQPHDSAGAVPPPQPFPLQTPAHSAAPPPQGPGALLTPWPAPAPGPVALVTTGCLIPILQIRPRRLGEAVTRVKSPVYGTGVKLRARQGRPILGAG